MTEVTTPSAASLRRLVPRIFARAQPVGAVEQLIKTVRPIIRRRDLGGHRARL